MKPVFSANFFFSLLRKLLLCFISIFKTATSAISLSGPVAKTMCSQLRGSGVQSLVRELDPTCHN